MFTTTEGLMHNIIAISIISENLVNEPKTQASLSTLKKHGWPGVRQTVPVWPGFSAKLKCVYEMAQRAATGFDHIMFVDARDVVVLGTPDQVLARFLEFDHPWVCGAEVNLWPVDSFPQDVFPKSSTCWRFLNSGAYLISCFEKWPEIPNVCDDQRWLTSRYLENPGDILLDTRCKLIQNMCGSDHLMYMEYGRAYNMLTHEEPLIIHFNGGTDITSPERRGLWSKK
jgi:hypothetical protein